MLHFAVKDGRVKEIAMKTTIKFSMILSVVMVVSGYTGSAYAAGAITSVSPNIGPVTGGQVVRIRGSGFLATGNTVTVGGVSATVNAESATVIDITTPAGAPGVANVVANGSPVFTYNYSSRNTTLKVVVSATIAKGVIVQWGDGTSNDDAAVVHNSTTNQFASYAWTVKDSSIVVGGVNQLELGASYRSDDATNNKTINIDNGSASAPVVISGTAAKTGGALLLGPAAGPDTFAISANVANQPGFLPLGAAPQTLSAAFANGAVNDQGLVLQFDTPTGITVAGNFAALQTFVVTLTGVAQ